MSTGWENPPGDLSPGKYFCQPIFRGNTHPHRFNMKKHWILALLVAFAAVTALPACRTKSGCQATESLKPKTNKKGEIIGSKRKRTDLFPKNMRKKM